MSVKYIYMEEILERALNIVKSNPVWTDYIKGFNHPMGFTFCEADLLNEIMTAIDEDYPGHSGASLALCLQKCKIILNNRT